MASEATVAVPANAVVIRFRPTDPESVLRWAEKEHRRIGYYRLSVFADAPREREDEDAVVRRLLAVSELAGVDPAGNKRVFVCAKASELLRLNFTFHKDEEEDELEEHYSVDLGPAPTVDDVRRFLEPFAAEGRQR